MNDTEFHQLVDEQMQIIEESIDDSGADIDYEVSGNVMTLEFEDRSQIIINRQEPMHEIWLASKSGGFHFKLIEDKWTCSKTGMELFEMVKQECENTRAKRSIGHKPIVPLPIQKKSTEVLFFLLFGFLLCIYRFVGTMRWTIITVRYDVSVTLFGMNDLIVLRQVKVNELRSYVSIIFHRCIKAVDRSNHLIF